MGACDISMRVDGNKTQDEVVNAFRKRQEQDRIYNGHQDGYSGDFQTVNRVDFTDKEFQSANDGLDYCLDHAQKWDSVVAVKVRTDTDYFWLVAGWGAE